LTAFLFNSCSFSLLPHMFAVMPLGIAQATISGMIVMTSCVVSIIVFGEDVHMLKLFFGVSLIVTGILVLHKQDHAGEVP
jgi:multidrug transporter EmrE-like cation transporter